MFVRVFKLFLYFLKSSSSKNKNMTNPFLMVVGGKTPIVGMLFYYYSCFDTLLTHPLKSFLHGFSTSPHHFDSSWWGFGPRHYRLGSITCRFPIHNIGVLIYSGASVAPHRRQRARDTVVVMVKAAAIRG